MNTINAVWQNIPLTIIAISIEYRFSRRILGLRYSGMLTFFIMLIVRLFAGWMNLYLHLAGDIGGNTFYFGLITLGTQLLLFKGNAIKKVFLTVLFNCGSPIIFYIFLPFVSYFFIQKTEIFLFALQIVEYINLLFFTVGMEYVGKKFQNLRRELPTDYTIYLTAVIIFIHVAIYSAYNSMLMIKNNIFSLPDVLTMVAFAIAGMVIVMIAIFAVDRQVNISLQEQLQVLQEENFKSREIEWRKLSGFRHDIKNHLVCLNNLLENSQTDMALAYMCSLTDTVKQLDSPVETGNGYADALLSVKYAQAMEANISVSIEMAIPPKGFINPVDLCCILSNAFDNAIAACKRLAEGEKWITARAFVKQGQFVISIKNSKPLHVTVIDGEVFPKETTADHGLGLDTVRAVVQKYGGTLTLSADPDFCFSVLLPQLRL